MRIKIGDNNKIKNSLIGNQVNINESNENRTHKKTFAEKHPILLSFSISIFVGFVLLFSFWKNIVEYIEGFLIDLK